MPKKEKKRSVRRAETKTDEELAQMLFIALKGKTAREVIDSFHRLQKVTTEIIDQSGDKFTVYQRLLGVSRVQVWRKLSDARLFGSDEIEKVLQHKNISLDKYEIA